jgi:hypothetical protein
MRLHLAAIAETLVFDDVPIAVRLAVFLASRLPKKHDDASLNTNSPLGIKEAFCYSRFQQHCPSPAKVSCAPRLGGKSGAVAPIACIPDFLS